MLMDWLVLASVPFDMPLPDAFVSMRANTSAVVVDGPGGPRLVSAGDMMEARNAAVDEGRNPAAIRIGDIASRLLPTEAPVTRRDRLSAGGEFGRMFSDGGMTPGERSQFESAFRKAPQPPHGPDGDENYLVQQITPDFAVVVTASERFAATLGASTMICTCAGDPVHTFEPRQLRVPGTCNKPHAKPVTCTTVGGLP